jgi:hypothetical protein
VSQRKKGKKKGPTPKRRREGRVLCDRCDRVQKNRKLSGRRLERRPPPCEPWVIFEVESDYVTGCENCGCETGMYVEVAA